MNWVLIIIFSWSVPADVAHSGFSVSFSTRAACKQAQELMRTSGSKSACLPLATKGSAE